jgi:hypothetical protein
LASIPGVGSTKLNRYADEVLALLGADSGAGEVATDGPVDGAAVDGAVVDNSADVPTAG